MLSVLCWVFYAECFMLSVLCWVFYADCHLCWLSFMLSVIYAQWHLCWVSFMLSVIYAECHLWWVSFMLCVIYAKCHYTICHNAECHCAECLYAECHGPLMLLCIFGFLYKTSSYPFKKRDFDFVGQLKIWPSSLSLFSTKHFRSILSVPSPPKLLQTHWHLNNIIITHADWLTDWMSASMLYACKGAPGSAITKICTWVHHRNHSKL